ncbi:MAG: DUF2249 domain-containing protein [Daejeonella sp.]
MMVITEETKISALIKANPLVIDTLSALNPHFGKLKNPILRNLLAGRVSISDACRIGGCEIKEFLNKMAEIGFEINQPVQPFITKTSIGPAANSLEFTKNLKVIELDVRPLLALKQDPLKSILNSISSLNQDECLKIINTFEPVPLISMLSKKGFGYHTERPDPETVITWFVRTAIGKTDLETVPEDPIICSTDEEFERTVKSFSPDKLHTIDVRELEMPLPMISILEHLKKMQPDEALFVYHKKVPVFLLPELQERGFKYFIQDTADNKVNMLICKL